MLADRSIMSRKNNVVFLNIKAVIMIIIKADYNFFLLMMLYQAITILLLSYQQYSSENNFSKLLPGHYFEIAQVRRVAGYPRTSHLIC